MFELKDIILVSATVSITTAVITFISYAVFRVAPWRKLSEESRRRKIFDRIFQVAVALFERGYYREARRRFELCLSLRSDNIDAVVGLQKCEIIIGMLENTMDIEAIELLCRDYVLETDYHYDFILGRSRYKQKKYQEALHYFEKAKAGHERAGKSLSKIYIDAVERIAWTNYTLGRFDRMLEFFEFAKLHSTADFRILDGLGYASLIVALQRAQGISIDNRKSISEMIRQAASASKSAVDLFPSRILSLVNASDCVRLLDLSAARGYIAEAVEHVNNESQMNRFPNAGIWYYTELCGERNTFSFSTLPQKKAYLSAVSGANDAVELGEDLYRPEHSFLPRKRKELNSLDGRGFAEKVLDDYIEVFARLKAGIQNEETSSPSPLSRTGR